MPTISSLGVDLFAVDPYSSDSWDNKMGVFCGGLEYFGLMENEAASEVYINAGDALNFALASNIEMSVSF